MSTISPLGKIDELKKAVQWMQEVLSSFENGISSRKEISHLARSAQKKIESYRPADLEKEHKSVVIDLCISLSTIDRAEGHFEPFYLDSLHDELEKVLNLLGAGENE